MFPMSANILLEIYKDSVHDHVIRLLLNGKVLQINGCDM